MYIYKITSPDGLCYIGSTTILLETRWAVHKSGFIRCIMGHSGFCSSYHLFVDYDPDECTIEIIETFPENTKRSVVLARERELIKQYDCVNIYGQKTDQEKAAVKKAYTDSHRETVRETARNYYAINAEREKARQKAYYYAKKAKGSPAPETV